MTSNDTPGEWMEMTPAETPSTTVTLTRVKAAELTTTDGMFMLALVLGVLGIVGLVAIVYLYRKDK